MARASLDELLLDYEDFLRQRCLRQWSKDDPEACSVRNVGTRLQLQQNDSKAYSCWLKNGDPAVIANAVICLIHQANYLLDRQILALERAFINEGGYSERLAAERIAARQRCGGDQGARLQSPSCPRCGKPLVVRTIRKGERAGSQFWGCSLSRLQGDPTAVD